MFLKISIKIVYIFLFAGLLLVWNPSYASATQQDCLYCSLDNPAILCECQSTDMACSGCIPGTQRCGIPDPLGMCKGPTPTPIPPDRTCNQFCTGGWGRCAAGLVCSLVSNAVDGNCRNPACPLEPSCVCPPPTPTPIVCQSNCAPGGYPICINNTQYQTCTVGADGCYHLGNNVCPGGQTCSGGACSPPIPPPAPTVILFVNGFPPPPPINYGGQAHIQWNSENTVGCVATTLPSPFLGNPNTWSGVKLPTNMVPGETINSITQQSPPSITFAISCWNSAVPAQFATAQVTLNILPPPTPTPTPVPTTTPTPVPSVSPSPSPSGSPGSAAWMQVRGKAHSQCNSFPCLLHSIIVDLPSSSSVFNQSNGTTSIGLGYSLTRGNLASAPIRKLERYATITDITYQRFLARVTDPASLPTVSGLATPLSGIYRNSSLTVSGSWQVGFGPAAHVLVFVDGNLTIESNITVAPGSFLAFIVSGAITIKPAVLTLEGLYFTNGTVTTEPSAIALVGRGSFIALRGFMLRRDLGGGNSATPAERFEERPDFFLSLLPKSPSTPIFTQIQEVMLAANYSWREVSP